jgi:hypothetical protein
MAEKPSPLRTPIRGAVGVRVPTGKILVKWWSFLSLRRYRQSRGRSRTITSPERPGCRLRLGNFADRSGTVVVLHLSTKGILDGRNVPRRRESSSSQNEPNGESEDICVSVLADFHKFCNELMPCCTKPLLWRSRVGVASG